MVKSKNHTNRNASFKAMRNGMKKPKCWKLKVKSLKYRGMKGMDPQFRRNQKYAKLGMKKAALRKKQSERDQKRNKDSKSQPKSK
mmetsp:Transcript_45842/g.41052  ORF Transcript_45842/g.41052 Transcript_45842/m.41052 type:complete len:85 (-) Transcript_45842:169-423(-)